MTTRQALSRPLRRALCLAAPSLLAAGCVNVGLGGDPAAHAHHRLVDAGGVPARRATPLVDALLIQPLPADAMADTLSIAYASTPQSFAFYQFGSWTERPVRQLPRLLQRRLDARGLAGAVALSGEPLRADWLLTVAIDTIHHDNGTPPGSARLALTLELFDRTRRTRVARRAFEAAVACKALGSAAVAQAMSEAVGQVFDAVQPWVESELQRAAAGRPAAP